MLPSEPTWRRDVSNSHYLNCCFSWVLWCSLTSQVISITFYIEREKSDKFCSEALILTWDSFTCRKSMTQDQWLYFPSEEKIHRPWPGLNPQTSDPVASMITMGPPGSTSHIASTCKTIFSIIHTFQCVEILKLVRELLQTVKLINIYEINVLRHF